MATYSKFNAFIAAVFHKKHDFSADTFKVALTNSAPSASNTVLADITEIAYTNLSTRTLTRTSSGQTAGLYKAIFQDLVLTASGGAVATFRYAVIYNDTATNDDLVGWYDYGVSSGLNDGETFTIDLDGVNGFIQAT